MKHFQKLLNGFRAFAADEKASTVPFIALGLVMLIGSVAVAVDMGRLQIVQSRMQNALDATGLAIGSEVSNTNLAGETTKYFYANFPANYLGTTITNGPTESLNSTSTVVSLSVSGTVPMTFMKIFGYETASVSAASQVTLQVSGMELVLVLDNTGSMNSPVNPSDSTTPKITALKSAATTLLNSLYAGNNTVSNLWVGVVPFTQTVNIGTGYSSWMDSTYDSALEFGPNITGTSCQSYSGNATTLSGGSDFQGSYATGVITFTSNPTNNETITLNGVTWTFVTGTASTNQTKIGNNLSSTMTSLASNLNSSNNSSLNIAKYYATTTALEITDKTSGTAGNSYTLAAGSAPASVTTPSSSGSYSNSPSCSYTLNGNSAAPRFVQMGNWGGCVMARAYPYDTTDDVPSTAPFQAYDYPPTSDAGYDFNPWVTISTSRNSPYTTTTTYNYSYQSNLPGYYGPNLFCPQQVLPMVAEESSVLSEINSLTAGGSTLIDVGMAWAYRMLSPNWQGLWGGEMNTNNLPLAYHTPLMNKVVILMTDGMNSMSSSNFTAYNYLDKGVLGSTTSITNGNSYSGSAEQVLDNRTLAICTALKNNGVIIYTIGFGTNGNDDYSDSTSVNGPLLQSCASQTSYYFLAPTNAQLQSAFQAIGDSLANLRISQ